MSTGSDSILDAFLYETNTLLEQLDSIVLSAEQQNVFSSEDINSIFRIMHTVKGSSAMMEYNSLMTIAHRAEDLFAIIREKGMDVVSQDLRPELFDVLFLTIDFFRQELELIQSGQPLTEDIDTLLQKINILMEQIRSGSSAQPTSSPGTHAPQNHFPYAIQVFFDDGCGMESLRAFMLVCSIRDLLSLIHI